MEKKLLDFQTTDELKLVIDYTNTIEQAIADGKYRLHNLDINAKNFPISPEMIEKKVEIVSKLFHFNCNMGSEDAIKKMDEAGYRPGTLMELLALAAIYPELQIQFPIVAVGPFLCNSSSARPVPFLFAIGNGRLLSLRYFGYIWSASFHFLGVRK